MGGADAGAVAMRDVGRGVVGRDAGAALWVGVGLILVSACARAMAAVVPMPWWDLSPAFSPAFLKGYGPGGSIVFDLVMLVGTALVFFDARGSMTRGSKLALGAGLIGLMWAVVHAARLAPGAGWPGGAVSIEDARLGSAWGSGLVAAAAMSVAARYAGVRACVLSVVIGFCAAIAVRGVVQVYIEHPATMRSFDSASFFAARGWDADSSMARGYLRRIGQAEASGWFFMSNVAASYAAAGLVAACSLLWVVLREHGRGLVDDVVKLRPAVMVGVVGLVAGVVGLWLTGSKGGPGAAVLVAVAMVGCAVLDRGDRTRRLAAWVGPMAIGAAVLVVVARGLIGERIGELSLLFRWFYMVGSARIFAGQPLVGVGPDGFRDAFLLSKPPICPEDVSDPHNVLLMFACALGFAGVAWCAVLVWWSSRMSAGLVAASECAVDERGEEGGKAVGESAWRTAALVSAGATLIAAAIERGVTSPSDALVRVVVLGVWAWVAMTLVRRGWWATAWGDRAVRVSLAGAGLVVLVHSQIEMTLTWGSSAPLGLVIVGAAAGVGMRGTVKRQDVSQGAVARGGGRAIDGAAWVGGVLVACVVVGVVLLRPVLAWERELRAGAFAFAPSAQIESGLREAVGVIDRNERRARLEAIAAEAGAAAREAGVLVDGMPGGLLGGEVPAQPAAIASVSAALRSAATDPAAKHLETALRYGVRGGTVRRELSQILLAEAVALDEEWRSSASMGDTPERAELRRLVRTYADRAIGVYVPGGFELGEALEWSPADADGGAWPATGWGWVATAFEVRARLMVDREGAELERAEAAYVHASSRDPLNAQLVLRRARVLERLGRVQEAKELARKALALDELARLDALVRGFSDADRGWLLRIAE